MFERWNSETVGHWWSNSGAMMVEQWWWNSGINDGGTVEQWCWISGSGIVEQLNNDSGTVEQWNRDRETLEQRWGKSGAMMLERWNREQWNNDGGTVEQRLLQVVFMPNITYNSCYCLFILQKVAIFTCRYFKFSWNSTALSESNCSNVSCSSINDHYKRILRW